jgi:hypothetical protein
LVDGQGWLIGCKEQSEWRASFFRVQQDASIFMKALKKRG